MTMINIEMADVIMKAYERWAKDVVALSHCGSAEGRYAVHEPKAMTVHAQLCEEALIGCRQALAALSQSMRESLLSQYMGLQGYYRKKINAKQRCRARGQREFDHMRWQQEVDLALLSFLNQLRKITGTHFNRYFIQGLNLAWFENNACTL